MMDSCCGARTLVCEMERLAETMDQASRTSMLFKWGSCSAMRDVIGDRWVGR